MDIGRTFSDSWRIFRANALTMIIGGVIVVIAGAVCSSGPSLLIDGEIGADVRPGSSTSTGTSLLTNLLTVLVVYPLLYGLLNVALQYAKGGRRGAVGDVFSGFNRWIAIVLFQLLKSLIYIVLIIPLTIAVVILVAILSWVGLVLAFIVLLAPVVFFETIWIYVAALLFDKECGLMEALSESRRQVSRNGFWPTFVVALLAGLAGVLVMVVTLGIGAVVVLPWLMVVIVAMYMQATDRTADLDAVLAGRRPGATAMGPYGMLPGGFPAAAPGAPPGAPASPPVGMPPTPTGPAQPEGAPPTPRVDAPPPWETAPRVDPTPPWEVSGPPQAPPGPQPPAEQ